ncbi:hypothetical protein IQ07DRAFT_646498 [Pyrenochaeta sp. DS3sAY3a]|nr:hypothetical protein IQ07DRAFT_646498 [Pyrenochaeta sp. DS3sAY3a]
MEGSYAMISQLADALNRATEESQRINELNRKRVPLDVFYADLEERRRKAATEHEQRLQAMLDKNKASEEDIEKRVQFLLCAAEVDRRAAMRDQSTQTEPEAETPQQPHSHVDHWVQTLVEGILAMEIDHHKSGEQSDVSTLTSEVVFEADFAETIEVGEEKKPTDLHRGIDANDGLLPAKSATEGQRTAAVQDLLDLFDAVDQKPVEEKTVPKKQAHRATKDGKDPFKHLLALVWKK